MSEKESLKLLCELQEGRWPDFGCKPKVVLVRLQPWQALDESTGQTGDQDIAGAALLVQAAGVWL